MHRESAPPLRDDRILPFTKAVGALVSFSVFGGFLLLYLRPDLTPLLWAWTIEPTLTPMLMGCGYLSGAYFFLRVVRGHQWHVVSLAFPCVAVFAWFMMTATVLHWDQFNQRHINFYAWVALYGVTPVLVPAIWWVNRRHDPGRTAGDVLLPAPLRVGMAVAGVVVFALVAVGFARPDLVIPVWPWALNTFTARIVTGWSSFAATFSLVSALDGRWSVVRLPMLSGLLGTGAMLIAVIRAWGELQPDNPLRWALVVALVLSFPGVLALTAVMDARAMSARAFAPES